MSVSQKPQTRKPSEKSSQPQAKIINSPLTLGLFGRSIIQSLPIGVVTFDPDLRIIEANAQAANLIGVEDYIDKALAKGTDNNGKTEPDWTKQLKSALKTSKTQSFERIIYRENNKTKFLRIICIPFGQSKKRRALGGSILIEEITEKINMQKQLDNAEKLVTIGKLASKVAHELNSPLDGILRYISLATRIVEQANLTKPKEYLDRCRQGLMKMVQIVSELLEFSRSVHPPLEYVNIEQIIEDALKTIDAKAESSNVHIFRYYSHDLPQIRSGNLFQVFCNIIKNAFDAMPDGGELHISIRLELGNTVVTDFRDTGKGFSLEHEDAMFEPFFTTKEKGTGLGLAICKDIIERYKGRITAENAPQGGSIFTVYLPVANYL